MATPTAQPFLLQIRGASNELDPRNAINLYAVICIDTINPCFDFFKSTIKHIMLDPEDAFKIRYNLKLDDLTGEQKRHALEACGRRVSVIWEIEGEDDDESFVRNDEEFKLVVGMLVKRVDRGRFCVEVPEK